MKNDVICCKAGTSHWCDFCLHARAHTRMRMSTRIWAWATCRKWHNCIFCEVGDDEVLRVRCTKVKP